MSTTSTLPPVAEMQCAYLQRDSAYSGLFVLGVRTTGIFCRPTCPARKPRPENVEYFATPREAIAAGYRPCKRCRPMDADEQPAWARRLIDEVDRAPAVRITEGELAARGVDPATVRRYFQRRYGMTFQAYARGRRLAGALHQIREGAPLDEAALDSGYESHSGFREAFVRTFGAPPGRSRRCRSGGGPCIQLAWLTSPLGPLVAGATDEGVCLLEFTDRRMLETELAELRKQLGGASIVPGTNRHLRQLEDELRAYFAGSLRAFTVPLVHPGTTFQERVWAELRQIPYGETRSYEALAAAVGRPEGQRAVGRANGMNRIAIVVPCHRVVRKDGQLGGYGGGLRRKEFLLALERRNCAVAGHGTLF
jgi:AraC family transcriptional regulator, regulatory protein of adaptative response / methylated-DNA-[protein]-cysteine methyltransferase